METVTRDEVYQVWRREVDDYNAANHTKIADNCAHIFARQLCDEYEKKHLSKYLHNQLRGDGSRANSTHYIRKQGSPAYHIYTVYPNETNLVAVCYDEETKNAKLESLEKHAKILSARVGFSISAKVEERDESDERGELLPRNYIRWLAENAPDGWSYSSWSHNGHTVTVIRPIGQQNGLPPGFPVDRSTSESASLSTSEATSYESDSDDVPDLLDSCESSAESSVEVGEESSDAPDDDPSIYEDPIVREQRIIDHVGALLGLSDEIDNELGNLILLIAETMRAASREQQ